MEHNLKTTKFPKYLIFIIIGAAFVVGLYYFGRHQNTNPIKSFIPSPTSNLQTATPSPSSTNSLAFPVNDFKARITKKPFGIYITPATSPVQSEKFTGYHTEVDVEYGDVTTDVPVYALAQGTIVYSNWVSGYGGVFMIEIQLNGAPHTVLYGHIRPSSLPKIGQKVTRGEQLAVLGTGYSTETDGERRHLHFAVLSDNRLDIKGYVQNQSQLSGWLDPLSLY